MVLMSDNPVTVYFLQANRQPEIQFDVFTAGFRSGTAHECGDEATSSPAVTVISSMSKTTGSCDHEKNRSQVARYASIPFDCNGGGTSNINMSGEWLRKIPFTSLRRTALAQFSTSWPISASSLALAIEPRHNVGVLIPTRLS
jgi:hypothetical protein